MSFFIVIRKGEIMVFISSRIKVDKIQNTITSDNAPSYPTTGQMWNDTSQKPPVLKMWDGSQWVVVNLSIKQLDPIAFKEIDDLINNTIDEVNASRDDINNALNQAQEALKQSGLISQNVEKITADVNEAKKNAQDAIDKANLNDGFITEIKKQQSEDGQKIADISQNYNGIQQSVTNLATKQESDRTQLAGMIQDKVSNEDFEASNTILAGRIDEVISSYDGRFNAMQSTIDSTTQTIKGIDGRVTQNTTSINGINTTVQNKADKTEVTQLAGQISETVESQEATNQRVATAEKNIEALTTSDGNQNKRLDTAEKSIQTISTKTDSNTELINETKKTADSNSSKIVDTSGRVSTVEQTLTKQSQTITDNTGKINKATQDIDSAKRTISDVAGRVSKVEQKADGISSTVSKVQTDLNTTNTKLNNKADTSYVNTQLGTKANQSDLNNTNNRLNGVDSNLNGLLNTGTNCWINSNFADGLNHWWKQNNNIQLKLDGEYLGTKVLDIKVPSNVGWVSAGTQERYPVTPGEKLSFSWWQNLIVTSSNNTFGEIQCYKDTTSGRIGTARLAPSDQTVNKWVLMKSEGWTVPKDCYYIGVNFCFSTNGEMKITQPQFVHGSKIPNYQPSPSDLNNAKNDINANKTQIQSQQTQINQTSGKVDIIASTNGNANAYFNINTNGDINIGASHRLVLSANTYVTDGFTFSANSIKAGSIKGNNMTINLDSGEIATSGLSNTSFKSGVLSFEDPSTHFKGKISASARRVSFTPEDSDYGFRLTLEGNCPEIWNGQSRLNLRNGSLNVNAGEIDLRRDGGCYINANGNQVELHYGNFRIYCRGGDIRFEMNGQSWYMKKQTFNGYDYPALVSSTGNSGFALGGNVPYVKSDGKWYSLNQIITKTGVNPVG